MTETASDRTLICPMTHLDDLGQRTKRDLIGRKLRLGTLQLHGDGGRRGTALGRTRGDNRRDVKRLGNIVLKERKSAMLTGVKEVLSFDSEEVQLDTIRGHLTITGKDLHVRRLTLERGEVDIDGTFDELKYSDPHTMNDTKSFLGRLFQ